MVTDRAEILLQGVVRGWPIGHVVTVEQLRRITGRHLVQVLHGWGEGAEVRLLTAHRGEQVLVVCLDLRHVMPRRMYQQVRGLVDPASRLANRLPVCGCRAEALIEKPLEALERLGEPPFSATRASEAWMAVTRSCKRRPAAANGGCPSSVKALRTARLYPRTAAAAASSCSSTLRSISRTPRNVFSRCTLA